MPDNANGLVLCQIGEKTNLSYFGENTLCLNYDAQRRQASFGGKIKEPLGGIGGWEDRANFIKTVRFPRGLRSSVRPAILPTPRLFLLPNGGGPSVPLFPVCSWWNGGIRQCFETLAILSGVVLVLNLRLPGDWINPRVPGVSVAFRFRSVESFTICRVSTSTYFF